MQEVENYRTDVRVVNLELLISDWYIEQMKVPKNQSAALPISMRKEDFAGEEGLVIYNYPPKAITLPADKQALLANGVLNAEELDLLEGSMDWAFQGRGGQNNPYILRKDSAMIDILRNVAAAGWDRPVYFGNTMPSSNFLNLGDFFRLEGMAYRVVPVPKSDCTPNDIYYGWIQQDTMFRNLTERFLFTGLNDPAVNLDEHIRNVIVGNYRNAFFRLENSYADQIFQLQQRLQESLSALQNGTPRDSLAEEPEVLQQQIQARQARIQTLLTHARENIPPTIIPKPKALIMTELQMLDKAGLGELAGEDLDVAIEQSMADLEIERARRGNLDPRSNFDMRICLVAIQFYLRQDQAEKAGALATRLKEITGSDVGNQVIQQELYGE